MTQYERIAQLEAILTLREQRSRRLRTHWMVSGLIFVGACTVTALLLKQ